MSFVQVIILAIVQGFAELLPVSSSAHVIVAEKLMGLDPSSPPMTLLLVMLHTGTMFAVIVHFWRKWQTTYFQSAPAFKKAAGLVILATVLTGVVGEGCIKIIEKTVFRHVPHAQIEDLFGHLELIAPALAAAGILILIAGIIERRSLVGGPADPTAPVDDLDARQASLIGVVQGLCLPFRGFSRSGATISCGMLAGVAKSRAENFSFALAVVLTPPSSAVKLFDWFRRSASATLPDSPRPRSQACWAPFSPSSPDCSLCNGLPDGLKVDGGISSAYTACLPPPG